MLRAVSDENFDDDILRGLLLRNSAIDLVRMQDAGLRGIADPQLLEWCAGKNRVLLTHDRGTIPNYAYERVRLGLSMPGVFVVDLRGRIGAIVEELLYLMETSDSDGWKDQVLFVNPSRR
jgi:hypothetical protein